MSFKKIGVLLNVVFFGLLAVISANAQGVIIPRPCGIPRCPRPVPIPQPLPNALPVKSIKLDTKIENQVATTRVEQVFRNDTAYTLEGTYFFPIPETASIQEFAIWENGKKLVGEVRSREEARRIYNEIVRQQRDPGLLEYAGKDLFQASIFPIPPNSDKKLELVYSQVLRADSGTAAYRYPLGTGKNLWRRPNPRVENPNSNMPQQNFGTVSGKIEIVGREALRNIYSPSHQIEVNKNGERRATISFETGSNNNDFQLFYGLSDNDFGLSLITYREPGKDGYFLLTLSPKDNLSERELINKDIIFVLDTSGSMADAGKIDKARSALLFGIRNLRDGDRFNVINFAGEEHLMEANLIKADKAGRTRGLEFVEDLKPTGGTNINDALKAALRQFDSSGRPKMLVFLTDGLPTVGETDADKIAANAKNIDVSGLRVFPFGVGYDVNTRLLDKLATANGGLAEYVEPKEDLEVKVSNFFAKVNSPVLSNIKLDFGSVKTDLTYPRELNVMFKGSQIVLIGRYENSEDIKNAVLKLTGKTGDKTRQFEYFNLEFPKRADKNDFLPRLWASRRVGWLVEQVRNNGENKELKDEIVELGTRYGIVTPYTSYLATDGSMQNQIIGRRNVSPSVGGAVVTADSLKAKSGRGAVKLSRRQNAMQANISVMESDENKADADQIFVQNTQMNQYVGTKNFVQVNNVWVDSEVAANANLPEIRIKFASEKYFDLIAKEKGLAKYFALGEEVAVVWKGNIYRITK